MDAYEYMYIHMYESKVKFTFTVQYKCNFQLQSWLKKLRWLKSRLGVQLSVIATCSVRQFDLLDIPEYKLWLC